MKNSLFILLFFISCGGTAQPILFNKLYQADTISMLATSIQPTQTGGYILIGGFNWINDYTAVYMRKLDQYGNTEKVVILADTIGKSAPLLHNSLIKSHTPGNYIVSATIGGTNDEERDFMLIEFNENGDVLWKHIYPQPNYVEGNAQAIATRDGGYLLHGWVEVNQQSMQFYLVKTDSTGGVEWERFYGDNNMHYLLHAEQTLDGGYLLSGQCHNSSTNWDMCAIKTDTMGLVEWEQRYGTNNDDGGCIAVEVAKGEYALVGSAGIVEQFQPFWYTEYQLYFARLDSNGVIVENSERYYINESNYSPEAVYLTDKKELIVATLIYGPSPIKPYFTKLTLSGDMLLNVPLSTGLGNQYSVQDYIRDIEPTSDGGYVMAGFNYLWPQSGWAVKVDSMGNTCGITDCDTAPVVIDAVTMATATEAASMVVSPNPTANTLNISYHLPPQFPFAVFELYNNIGQKVLYKITTQTNTQISLSVADIPSGIYFYRFANNNNLIANGKVVIVH